MGKRKMGHWRVKLYLSCIRQNCEDLDPHFFTDHQSAYLYQIKTCYYSEKNNRWIFIMWSIWQGRLYSSRTY